ncbi:MAG TPA: copper-translocating P-type ATPase [Candidatus Paceibacterota bacterium]|nr:copper-translocating P-type ATPase [Candidatus Paceibacterota bacterium]
MHTSHEHQHDHPTPPPDTGAKDMERMSHLDHDRAMTDPAMAKAMEYDMRRRFLISLALSVPAFLYSPAGAELLGGPLVSPIPVNLLLLVLTTPIVFWTGSIFVVGAYHALRTRALNMSVLIATGVLAAYLGSIAIDLLAPGSETFYEASALLVTFVLFGHWMEMKSRRGTSDALRALFDLVPPTSTVIRDGSEVIVPSADIVLGDRVLLRPGDKVPVDGAIETGETAIDESLVTGESIPVTKSVGDRVVGGSVNQSGSVTFRATGVGKDTVLARIIAMVETAQNSKAPGQRIADRWAAWLVVLAVGAGIAAFIGWYVFAGATFLTALTFAIATVVIACPDALGLATPTAVAVATGMGARRGILIKDAATLEGTSRISAIVLDKTGTLTEGKPRVTEVVAFGATHEDELVRIAASIESRSNHPIARAILDEASRRTIAPAFELEAFVSLSGLGLEATIEGKKVFVGTERLLAEKGIVISENEKAVVDRMLSEGKTLSLVAVDGACIGAIAVSDPIRPSAAKAIRAFRALGIEPVMITGDHARVAAGVASTLGITRVFAEVLPEEKAQHVKALRDEGKFVAMVGDGVNDAPALAGADIGIAIGAGTDVAIETGSIVLMRSDPYDIVAAIRLSKATVRKMHQNLFWAAIYNVLAIPVAAGVFMSSFGWSLRPEVAALLMSLSSLIVASNAVLLRFADRTLGE